MNGMKKDDIYYKAMLARDHRFDGKFFVGVKTTGIYCRPICPARPKRENVEFFNNRLEAEKAGYRPCLRCHPESAPMSKVWIGTSAIVKRAIKILHNMETLDFDEDKFAAMFGVSARHLRRLFMEEIGKRGALTAGYTIVRLNGEIKNVFHDWLYKTLPDRADKIWKQISECHGGQVNDSRFGTRMSGEGKIAESIGQLFDMAKKKYLKDREMPDYDFTNFKRPLKDGDQLELFK